MPKLSLARILIGDDPFRLRSSDVFDGETGETLETQIRALKSALSGLASVDVGELQSDLQALETTINTFISGEDDDNGSLDRLKELVAAIEANRGSIDALVSDKASQEALDSLIARVKALEDKDWQLLDGLGRNEATGNLTFNGKELNGETGIAIGASVEAASVYNGRIRIVVEEVEIAD